MTETVTQGLTARAEAHTPPGLTPPWAALRGTGCRRVGVSSFMWGRGSPIPAVNVGARWLWVVGVGGGGVVLCIVGRLAPLASTC